MLRITLEQWRMFLSVVEHGGFNQASQAIFKSQSSIHNAVRKIEGSLGVKLFRVEGRKTVLTDSGEMMLRRARYLVNEAEKVEFIGLNLSQGVEARLNIAVDEVFPREWLYQVLENVSAEYPLLQIEVYDAVLSGSIEQLEHDEVEIAISPISFGSGFSESLLNIDFYAVASPQHALHNMNRALSLEDLKSHRQIVVRDSGKSAKYNMSDGWLEANHRWTVSHMQNSIDIICKGLGYAWLPLSLIEDHLKKGRLKPLELTENTKRSAQLYVTFKDGDLLGPAARTFLGELRLACDESRFSHSLKEND